MYLCSHFFIKENSLFYMSKLRAWERIFDSTLDRGLLARIFKELKKKKERIKKTKVPI